MEQKDNLNKILNILQIGAIGYGIYTVGGALGFWDTITDKQAEKWRTAAALGPDYYKKVLKVTNVIDAANKIYDHSDIQKIEIVRKAIGEFYNSKGILIDNENNAITWLEAIITSKTDLSIFSDLFEHGSVATLSWDWKSLFTNSLSVNVVNENFRNYMDSFLENRYQARLWKWYKKLPLLSKHQINVYEARTGHKVYLKNE